MAADVTTDLPCGQLVEHFSSHQTSDILCRQQDVAVECSEKGKPAVRQGHKALGPMGGRLAKLPEPGRPGACSLRSGSTRA